MKLAKVEAAHVVEQLLAAEREAAGAVGHQALALGRADRLAQVGLGVEAVLALAALGRIERNDVVALGERADAGAGIDHHAGALVAQDGREQALRIAPERVNSSVWQMPVALISTRTSPSRGPSNCTVSIG